MQRADAALLDALVPQADVVLDCCDNFATRQAVNRACVAHGKPLVSGAAIRFDGQLSVFDPRDAASPCYACLFPPDAEFEETRCAVLGVFAPLVGIIGTLQASEALKLLAGIGPSLAGRLLMFDGAHALAVRHAARAPRDPALHASAAPPDRLQPLHAFCEALAVRITLASLAAPSARRRGGARCGLPARRASTPSQSASCARAGLDGRGQRQQRIDRAQRQRRQAAAGQRPPSRTPDLSARRSVPREHQRRAQRQDALVLRLRADQRSPCVSLARLTCAVAVEHACRVVSNTSARPVIRPL